MTAKNLTNISRRTLLSGLGLGVASAAALPILSSPAWAFGSGGDLKTLILIELEGGNDGLNTVAPITDPRYAFARPTLALTKETSNRLDADTGLHGLMTGTSDLWNNGDLRIVEGVGYENPNRSHFRSIEIWNHGMGAISHETKGWVSQAMAGSQSLGSQVDADGLVLSGGMGPMAGPGRFAVLQEFEGLDWQREVLAQGGANISMMSTNGDTSGMAHMVRDGGGTAEKSALDHLLTVQSNAAATLDTLERKLRRARQTNWQMPDTELGWQLSNALTLLEAGVRVPVLKVSMGGFDTHANQAGMHDFLMEELDQAVTGFSNAAKQMGIWNDIVLMTYSEFGRRFFENGSMGTDHGTAAPVLISGGAVSGGFGGRRPSLEAADLVDDDMVHSTDLRSVYNGVLNDLWNIPGHDQANFKPETILG